MSTKIRPKFLSLQPYVKDFYLMRFSDAGQHKSTILRLVDKETRQFEVEAGSTLPPPLVVSQCERREFVKIVTL